MGDWACQFPCNRPDNPNGKEGAHRDRQHAWQLGQGLPSISAPDLGERHENNWLTCFQKSRRRSGRSAEAEFFRRESNCMKSSGGRGDEYPCQCEQTAAEQLHEARTVSSKHNSAFLACHGFLCRHSSVKGFCRFTLTFLILALRLISSLKTRRTSDAMSRACSGISQSLLACCWHMNIGRDPVHTEQ